MSTAKPSSPTSIDANGANGSVAKPLHVFVQLRAMHNVPENWDGYGGAATDPKAIEAAVAFLHNLAQYDIGCRLLPAAEAAPTRTGGVMLIWENAPHELDVEFDPVDPPGALYYHADTRKGEEIALDKGLDAAPRFFELATLIAPPLNCESSNR